MVKLKLKLVQFFSFCLKILPNNKLKYNLNQKIHYYFGTSNHDIHNTNPEYWKVLLRPITENPQKFKNSIALDFGCGKGRNILNLNSMEIFSRVDGVDISVSNINFLNKNYSNLKSIFFRNNGLDLREILSNQYTFVMSTIVFQHIPVYKIRDFLLREIFRVLKKNGIFSFQMGYGVLKGKKNISYSLYSDNCYEAQGTNGNHDVRIINPDEVINHLTEIGFKFVNYSIGKSWHDNQHPNWIYFSAIKN